MREAYVHGATAREAIEVGFVSSAPVVSAAAAIMFGVFAMFVPDGDFSMKPMAVGLAVGIFFDAFIVRMAFVPAVLALLGDRAWTLPPWLDRLLPRLDVEGEGVHRVLDLAEWPEPGSDLVLAAEGLAPAGWDGEPIETRLSPGGVLLIEGAPDAGKSTLLLALTGRARIAEGKAKVLGHVLPDEAEEVRTRIPLVCCEHDEVFEQLDEALAARPAIIGIDDLDALRGVDCGPFLERLGEARRRAEQAGRPIALIVTTSTHGSIPAELAVTATVRLGDERSQGSEETL
jgi:RND superfamily putative drug exporter